MDKKYDAILVLGVSTDINIFAPRVNRAVKLYKRGVAPLIILSGRHWGGLTLRPRKTESQLMRNYAIKKGVPPRAARLEKRSLNTIGNFYFVRKDILEKSNIHSLVVITQRKHLSKAKFLAKKILGSKYSISWIAVPDESAKTTQGHFGVGEIKKKLNKEKDGNLNAIKNLLAQHPYYRRYKVI